MTPENLNIPDGLTTGQSLTAIREGGIVNTAYLDSRGFWTVGIGCKGPGIVQGTYWTNQQATTEFLRRYALAASQAAIDLGNQYWEKLSEARRAALTDMAYNEGGAGLDDFHLMLQAIRDSNWQEAHDQCLASKYANQLPARANSNAQMLLTGAFLS